MELEYNTQRGSIKMGEYGRRVQEMIEHLKTVEDREKRTRMANTIFQVMVNLNPEIKEQKEYERTVWDHMYELADYDLDIDIDFKAPQPEEKDAEPDHIGYKGVLSKYRFYGRNLLEMIDSIRDMEDGEIKTSYLNYIASFMLNSSKNWNDEDLTPKQICQHLADLSNGEIQTNPEDLELITYTIRKKFTNRKKKRPSKYKNRR